MTTLVPVSEARVRLAELIVEADGEEVLLLKHGRPVGVLLSHEGYERLLDYVEDLEDELSVLKAGEDGPPIPLEKLRAELGL